MSDSPTDHIVDLDHECVTDSILRAASRQASVAKHGSDIVIDYAYESPAAHDDVIRLLLARKVRATSPPLQYRSTLFGKHTFRVP